MKNRHHNFVYLLTAIIGSCLLMACNSNSSQQNLQAQCPQSRATEMAPAAVASLINPLANDETNIEAGENLYQDTAKPVACAQCHGDVGDGNGIMANMFEPAPRNFTCAETNSPLPDGQYFWIIKNGSIGTSMPAFNKLSDKQIWQLTMYLRSFEKKSKLADTAKNMPLDSSSTSL